MGIETWLIRKPELTRIKLMVVGEALETSDLFSKMLKSIELLPEDVTIKSSLSVDIIQQITNNPPQLLLALGNTATQALLNKTQPLNELRCKMHDYYGIPLIVSYHPTDLLRHPTDKKNAWQDLSCIQQMLTQLPC